MYILFQKKMCSHPCSGQLLAITSVCVSVCVPSESSDERTLLQPSEREKKMGLNDR